MQIVLWQHSKLEQSLLCVWLCVVTMSACIVQTKFQHVVTSTPYCWFSGELCTITQCLQLYSHQHFPPPTTIPHSVWFKSNHFRAQSLLHLGLRALVTCLKEPPWLVVQIQCCDFTHTHTVTCWKCNSVLWVMWNYSWSPHLILYADKPVVGLVEQRSQG